MNQPARSAATTSSTRPGDLVLPFSYKKLRYRRRATDMKLDPPHSHAFSPLLVQSHVLNALMLRDMRTRFGGSHLGYIVAVGWPCAHIFVLVAILTFRGLPAPLGDSTVLFIATGTTPYITFMYTSRKIMEGISANKPLIYFPAVSLFDVIISRALVELITCFATTVCVVFVLACLGVDFIPAYPSEALFAYASTILFSIGVGIINANIFLVFPGWGMGYVLIIIAGYSLSGVFFLPDLTPERVYHYLSWNPMLQNISWFRVAFYPGYGDSVAKLYAIMSGLIVIFVGLALERYVMRKKISSI